MTIKTRIAKHETEAAAHARPTSGWARYWAALRKCYGDGGNYTPVELEQLDRVDPKPAFERAQEMLYGPKRNES